MATSILAASAGVYVAWSQYRERTSVRFDTAFVVHDSGHYLERIYGTAFLKPVFGLSEFLRNLDFDRLIGALVVRPVFGISDKLRAADIDTVYTKVFVDGVSKAAEGFAWFDGGVVDRGMTGLGSAGLGLARACQGVDTRAVDRTVDGVGEAVQRLGARMRRLQTGFVANYALLMLGLGALIFYLAVVFTRGNS
jgi:NADH:ubiquinone oxidoreductase subunit 5 (subunit L)/multisubunit Na+/H+ antiporter MnhA subunit